MQMAAPLNRRRHDRLRFRGASATPTVNSTVKKDKYDKINRIIPDNYKFSINFDGNLKAISSFCLGVVGASSDLSLDTLLINAGRFNRYFGNTKRELDEYGNSPVNSKDIIIGYNAYKNGLLGKNK